MNRNLQMLNTSHMQGIMQNTQSYLKQGVNVLSLTRVVIALPTAWCIVSGYWLHASLLALLAVVSDLLDGYLARRYHVTSITGGLLDHSSDAIFVSTCLFALSYQKMIPVLLPVLVILAFLQYLLDSKALAGQILRTSTLGRNNGIAYFALVCLGTMGTLLMPTVITPSLLILLGWLMILTTLLSMLDRLQAFIKSEAKP